MRYRPVTQCRVINGFCKQLQGRFSLMNGRWWRRDSSNPLYLPIPTAIGGVPVLFPNRTRIFVQRHGLWQNPNCWGRFAGVKQWRSVIGRRGVITYAFRLSAKTEFVVLRVLAIGCTVPMARTGFMTLVAISRLRLNQIIQVFVWAGLLPVFVDAV